MVDNQSRQQQNGKTRKHTKLWLQYLMPVNGTVVVCGQTKAEPFPLIYFPFQPLLLDLPGTR